MPPKYSFFKMQRQQKAVRKNKQYSASREGQLRAVAHQLGMHYRPIEEYSNRNLLSEFHLFQMGRHKTITNIIEHRDDNLDTRVQIFDYRFETGSNTSKRVFNQSVFFVQSKKLALPEFTMKPESIFHKIGNYLFRMEDIDFEAYPKFSGNYLLKGEDEEYIRFMMNEKLLRYFSRDTGWSMEGINFYMILYKHNQRFTASSIKAFYEQGRAVYESMAKEMQWEPIKLKK